MYCGESPQSLNLRVDELDQWYPIASRKVLVIDLRVKYACFGIGGRE